MKKRLLGTIVAVIIISAVPVVYDAPALVTSFVDAAPVPVKTVPANSLTVAALRKAASVAPKKIIAANGRESVGVKTTADKIFVCDLLTGTELYSENANERTPIASITKLMTALVVLENHPDWNKKVTLEKPVDGGGLPFFAPGDIVTVRDLWQAMLVGSSNAAAVALASSVGLSQNVFVSEMNARAAGLGLSSTHFVEPTGLSPDNVSTAHDVYLLLKAAIQKKEIVASTLSSSYELKKIFGKTVRILTTDKLLSSFVNKKPYKILGAKTGFIDESGHNIAVSFSKDGAGTIAVIVIGSVNDDARFQDAKSLAYWTYENYRWPAKLSAASK